MATFGPQAIERSLPRKCRRLRVPPTPRLAAEDGDPTGAARLLGHARRHRQLNSGTLPPIVAELLASADDRARVALGDVEFATAADAGLADDLRAELAAAV
jgi:hypothetical protein